MDNRNSIKVLNNEEFGAIRTIEVAGKLYFVGKDIAETIGYARPTKAIQDHCKGVLKWDIPAKSNNQHGEFRWT